MRIPGLTKRTAVEPVAALTPLQELLTAENRVSLAQGEIDALNKEFGEWLRHWGVIETTDGQFHGILNESLLSEQVTEIQLRDQFSQFQVRKNVLLRTFHEKLAAWAGLKQRHSKAFERANALPMLAPLA